MNTNTMNNDFYRQMELINDITKAIDGEYSAIACYNQIAQMAPTNKERQQILEIRKDEINHFQKFSQIYIRLTGRQPTPKITEPCPKSYRKGLDFAFNDEQHTVDFYLDLAEKASDSQIKGQFKKAASDEQNHAVWFLYFLQQESKDKNRLTQNYYQSY